MKKPDELRPEGEHIFLRETRWEDLTKFAEWERKEEVTKYFSIPDSWTREDVCRQYFADMEAGNEQWTILLKRGTSQPKKIGRIILKDKMPGWKAEIFRIYIGLPEERGKGYGREAMELIMNHCFEDLKLERLYLDHYEGNPAGRLYLSLGFRYEGVLRKNCRKNDRLYDVHLMSILKDEYQDHLASR